MTCPICGERTQHDYRPFCSKRCADRDLGNWFNGSYSLPSNELEDFEKEQEIPEPAPRQPH